MHLRRRTAMSTFPLLLHGERAVDRDQGSADPPELARGHFREPGERAHHECARMSPARFEFNRHGVWAIYKFEIAARAAHPGAKPGDAGHHDLALLRRVRRGDRVAHDGGERRELRRVHRARPHHAGPVHREPVERLLRDILSRNSSAPSTNCCRRPSPTSRSSSPMSAPPRPNPWCSASSSWRRPRCSCRSRSCTRVLMVGLSGDDGRQFQPVRIHSRPLGQGLGAAAAHSHAGGHPAHLPRRRVLLDRHAAAGVARIQPVQSRRVPHQRLSMVLLRERPM